MSHVEPMGSGIGAGVHKVGAWVSTHTRSGLLSSDAAELVRRRVFRSSFSLLAAVADALDGAAVRWWVGGGWGIDVLVGRQLRDHDDIDVGVDWRDDGEQRAIDALAAIGFSVTVPRAPSGAQFPDRVVLRRHDGRILDLLVVHESGVDDRPAPAGIAVVQEDEIQVGRLQGRPFRCLSAQRQLDAHLGYPLDRRARRDVTELCRASGLAVPRAVSAPPPHRWGGPARRSLSRSGHRHWETALVAPLTGISPTGVTMGGGLGDAVEAGLVLRRPFVPGPWLGPNDMAELADLVARHPIADLALGSPQRRAGHVSVPVLDREQLSSLGDAIDRRWPPDPRFGERLYGPDDALVVLDGVRPGSALPSTVRVNEIVLYARRRDGQWSVVRRFPLAAPNPAQTISIERISDVERLELLIPEWRSLADGVGDLPFSTPEHALTWWRGMGRGRLMVLAARRGERLVGLALFHRRLFGPVRLLRPLGHGLGATEPVLAVDDAVRAALLDELSRSGIVQIPALVESPLAAWARSHGRATRVDVCPVVALAREDGEPARAALPASLAKSIRRSVAALDRDGRRYETSVLEDPGDIAAILDDLVALGRRADAARQRSALFEPPCSEVLCQTVAGFAARGRALVSVVRLDGAVAAFDIGLRHRRELVVVTGRFDPDAARYGLGHLSLRALADAAVDRGVVVLDLQLGTNLFKERWSTGERTVWSVLIAPRGTRTAASRALDVLERRHLRRRPQPPEGFDRGSAPHDA